MLCDSRSTSPSSLRVMRGRRPFMNIRHAACESVMTAMEFPLASACLIAKAIAVASAVLVQWVLTEAEILILEWLESFAAARM